MLSDLKEDAFLLAYTMKTMAVSGGSASWEQYREYVLWHMLVSGRRTWGQTTVAEDSLAALRLLADRVGGWIYVDAERGETYVPLAEWQPRFAQALRDYPDILRFF